MRGLWRKTTPALVVTVEARACVNFTAPLRVTLRPIPRRTTMLGRRVAEVAGFHPGTCCESAPGRPPLAVVAALSDRLSHRERMPSSEVPPRRPGPEVGEDRVHLKVGQGAPRAALLAAQFVAPTGSCSPEPPGLRTS